MINRLRRSLGARILILAGVNAALLIAIGLLASGIRVPRSPRQLVLQSAEGRLQDVARRIALDVEHTQEADANALLDRYAVEYRTRFILVHNDGTRIAGADVALPDNVRRALAGPPPDEGRGLRDGFRPPPPKAFPPPGGLFDGPPERPEPRAEGPRMPQTPARLISTDTDPRHWIVLRLPIRFAGTASIVPGSLIVVPFGFFGDPLLFPLKWIWWVMMAVAVTVACWWPLLRGITGSLVRMEQATEQIALGRFDTTVAVARHDELGRLSSSIDTMAARLGAMVSGQRRFLGDTAHELRSPLGRMQVALEILDTRVQPEERAYVIDLKEDVEALSQLTDELLLYARAELSDRNRPLQRVDLAPVIERTVAKEGNGCEIQVSVDPAISVAGDAQLIERAIANVVRNAVKYAGAAGPITIAANLDGQHVVVTIADHGPGVADESLARLFDPFFREDAARNRKTGGVGLGLAIVRSAVEACGGSVRCRNRQPHGLEVELTWRPA